jgi:L-lactate dehydrogenase complex protein LldG
MAIYKTSKAKENILRKIRQALHDDAVPQPFPETDKRAENAPLFEMPDKPLEELFAETFTQAGGNFVFCNDYNEVAQNLSLLAESRNWTEVLCPCVPLFATLMEYKLPFLYEYNPARESANACITDCEAAIARTGSYLFSSRQNYGRTSSIYFPVHIVLLSYNQIFPDIDKALTMLQNKYQGKLPSMINLNTGPSRTADIEKTLVTGIHGPKEIFCFFVNT